MSSVNIKVWPRSFKEFSIMSFSSSIIFVILIVNGWNFANGKSYTKNTEWAQNRPIGKYVFPLRKPYQLINQSILILRCAAPDWHYIPDIGKIWKSNCLQKIKWQILFLLGCFHFGEEPVSFFSVSISQHCIISKFFTDLKQQVYEFIMTSLSSYKLREKNVLDPKSLERSPAVRGL